MEEVTHDNDNIINDINNINNQPPIVKNENSNIDNNNIDKSLLINDNNAIHNFFKKKDEKAQFPEQEKQFDDFNFLFSSKQILKKYYLPIFVLFTLLILFIILLIIVIFYNNKHKEEKELSFYDDYQNIYPLNKNLPKENSEIIFMIVGFCSVLVCGIIGIIIFFKNDNNDQQVSEKNEQIQK